MLFTMKMEDITNYPLMIHPNLYEGGGQFVVQIKYDWKHYPEIARDFTVKLYSKHDLKIFNNWGVFNEIKMDDVNNYNSNADF